MNIDRSMTVQPGLEPILRCRHLLKRYGERTVVNGVDFEIAPGETYGLLGPNGAGKTTIISMVCGLLVPDAGPSCQPLLRQVVSEYH